MSRREGTLKLSSNIEPRAAAPLDARLIVPTLADLTASGAFPYPYVGMIVSVQSEGKAYILTANNPTVSVNWTEIGSGSGDQYVIFGYYNTSDGKFYEESTFVTEITASEKSIYVDLNTNYVYRYNELNTEYIQIGGEKALFFGYYKTANDKFYADQAYTVELPEDEEFLYTDISAEKLYRYRTITPSISYYAWKEAVSADVYYTLSATPSVGDALYSTLGTTSGFTVASYDSMENEITFEDDESNTVTLDRDSADDASASETHFVEYGYDFNYLTADDIDTLMESVAYSQWSYLAETIMDTIVSAQKVWSSNKTNTEIQAALDAAKLYADQEIAKFSSSSYSLVSSTSEMVNPSVLYLLPVSGANYYDIYALVDSVPTAIGTTQIQLNNYYTKDEADAAFLSKTDFEIQNIDFQNDF